MQDIPQHSRYYSPFPILFHLLSFYFPFPLHPPFSLLSIPSCHARTSIKALIAPRWGPRQRFCRITCITCIGLHSCTHIGLHTYIYILYTQDVVDVLVSAPPIIEKLARIYAYFRQFDSLSTLTVRITMIDRHHENSFCILPRTNCASHMLVC